MRNIILWDWVVAVTLVALITVLLAMLGVPAYAAPEVVPVPCWGRGWLIGAAAAGLVIGTNCGFLALALFAAGRDDR
jgi:hypothetical protein